MADKFAATGAQPTTTATPGDSSLAVEGDALVRGRLYDIMVSALGAPADNALEWLIRRATALGTPDSAVTPQLLDSDGPAAQLSAGEDYSVEPTYAAGSELLDFGLNQRATNRWVAREGSELMVPATATAAIGATAFHASYAGSAEANFMWEE